MDEVRRDQIIDDLLRKDPRCQYSDELLFDLGFRHKFQIESYLCKRFYGASSTYGLGRKKATVTRRAKRLWSRMMEAVNRVTKAGGEGVYEVSEAWKFSLPAFGFIFARDIEEAACIAEMFFGFLVEDVTKLELKFVERGGPDQIQAFNEDLIGRYGRLQEEAAKKLAEAERDLTLSTKMLMYLENFSPETFKP